VRAWDDKFPCFVLITITTHENGKRFIIFHLSYTSSVEKEILLKKTREKWEER